MARDIDDVDQQRLSRRSALKGLGAAGTVAAWTAPTILSTPAASAATGLPNPCGDEDCGPDDCNDQNVFGTDSVTGAACSCKQNVPVGTGCSSTQNVPCNGLVACSEQAPCGEGFACQIGCCGTPLCFPLCA